MTKKLTISALLVALAMILSYVEVLIPFNFGEQIRYFVRRKSRSSLIISIRQYTIKTATIIRIIFINFYFSFTSGFII